MEIWSGGKIDPAGPILATKSGPAGPTMTPKFVRFIQNWSGHIDILNTWRLILFSVKMADSSEEGDAQSGNLVEEAYEYLVRNVPGGGKRSTQAMHTKKGSEICCEKYFKKKKGKVCSFQFG